MEALGYHLTGLSRGEMKIKLAIWQWTWMDRIRTSIIHMCICVNVSVCAFIIFFPGGLHSWKFDSKRAIKRSCKVIDPWLHYWQVLLGACVIGSVGPVVAVRACSPSSLSYRSITASWTERWRPFRVENAILGGCCHHIFPYIFMCGSLSNLVLRSFLVLYLSLFNLCVLFPRC